MWCHRVGEGNCGGQRSTGAAGQALRIRPVTVCRCRLRSDRRRVDRRRHYGRTASAAKLCFGSDRGCAGHGVIKGGWDIRRTTATTDKPHSAGESIRCPWRRWVGLQQLSFPEKVPIRGGQLLRANEGGNNDVLAALGRALSVPPVRQAPQIMGLDFHVDTPSVMKSCANRTASWHQPSLATVFPCKKTTDCDCQGTRTQLEDWQRYRPFPPDGSEITDSNPSPPQPKRITDHRH